MEADLVLISDPMDRGNDQTTIRVSANPVFVDAVSDLVQEVDTILIVAELAFKRSHGTSYI